MSSVEAAPTRERRGGAAARWRRRPRAARSERPAVHVLDRVAHGIARLVVAFLYVPIVAVVAYSFNASDIATIWTTFSTHWYGVLLHDAQIHQAVEVSLEVAALASTAATGVALLAVPALRRLGARTRGVIVAGVILPLVVPEIVLGIAILSVCAALHLPLSLLTLVGGHFIVTLPYASLILIGAYAGIDPDYGEAAADLGCTPLMTFRRVTFPLLRQAIVASWLLCFTLSFGDIVMSTFVSGVGTTTLPLLVYSRLKGGLTPEINALGTVLVVGTSLIIFAVGLNQVRRIVTTSLGGRSTDVIEPEATPA